MYNKENIFTWLKQYYQLEGSLSTLLGEVDYNYKLTSGTGEEFTIKISRPDMAVASIQFQAAILNHLIKKEFPYQLPEIVKSIDGEDYIVLETRSILRVQKWVPGRVIDDINPKTDYLWQDWGKMCGLLSRCLADFKHDYAKRFYKWNPNEALFSKKYRDYIDPEKLELADHFWDLFEDDVLERLPGLRKSINYNDAHLHNLLSNDKGLVPEITGLIDFGDAIFSETINELAIACAYAGMNNPDPLSVWKSMIKAYHNAFAIQESELEVLFPLIGARLVISVANSAFNKHMEPENQYLLVSEKPAWDLLEKMSHINLNLATYTFRSACGYPAVPQHEEFLKWIELNRKDISPVMKLREHSFDNIDLSVGSVELGNNQNFSSINHFNRKIQNIHLDKEVDLLIGGYSEPRPFYAVDLFRESGNNGVKWRTLHLGGDIWSTGKEPVYAPLDASIHSVANLKGDLDYGPTLILRHTVNTNLTFYTLYGHLDGESVSGLLPGQKVKKGEQIAKIGMPPNNGNWPPHLHFQIVLDMLDFKVDFPGVSHFDEKDVWLKLSPDPSVFFGLDEGSFSHDKNNPQNNDDLKERRRVSLGKSLSLSYGDPLQIVRGYKQYLYSVEGRKYLDTVNNVAHVGHEHPDVVRVAQEQIALLNTNTRYLHSNIIEYAEALLSTFPSELSVVYFVNSGSEANELAMRMVEAYNGSREMIAVEVGYHGNTGGCIDISSYKFDGKAGKGAPERTSVVPIPDIYRGLHKNGESAGPQYASYIKKSIDLLKDEGKQPGAFICESILSCGGQIVLPKGYLQEAYGYMRAAGGLCIADEVQVGFGRVGNNFWAFELQDEIPDIVTLGKPIGNGHPLAAVVTTKKVADAFNNGMEYFNTYGGNPVSCAIGLEVLKVIKRERLQQNALETGNYLKKGLGELMKDHELIGDVRGHGFFLGIELVNSRSKRLPAAKEAGYLVDRMKELGILMSTDGPDHNVLKFKPPMCFNPKDADFLINMLDKVLREDFLRKTNAG